MLLVLSEGYAHVYCSERNGDRYCIEGTGSSTRWGYWQVMRAWENWYGNPSWFYATEHEALEMFIRWWKQLDRMTMTNTMPLSKEVT